MLKKKEGKKEGKKEDDQNGLFTNDFPDFEKWWIFPYTKNFCICAICQSLLCCKVLLQRMICKYEILALCYRLAF